MDNTDSLISIIKVFKKWYKAIFIVCSIAILGTVLLSLSMDNYYKATTIFYAASADLAKPAPIGGFEIDMDYYGRDEDIDRLLSIANSGELANQIISEFNLAEHYNIKSDTPKGKYKVSERFQKLFKIQKNKFDAIEISVEDIDPELAKSITNRIRVLLDEFAQRTVKKSQTLLISKYKNSIVDKETEMDSLIINIERQKTIYGIYDVKMQGQILSENLANTQTQSLIINAKLKSFSRRSFQDSLSFYNAYKSSIIKQIKAIEEQLNNYKKGSSRILALEQEQKEFGLQLSLDKERFKQLVSAEKSKFNSIHLIEAAEVPLVKSRPRRSILVIAAGMISLFFSLLAVLIVEKFRSINWKKI